MRVHLTFPLLAALLLPPMMALPTNAAPAAKEEAVSNIVDIGALTFAVESPMYKQYVVTKISVEFVDPAQALQYSEAGKIVRMRDVVLTTLLDIRPSVAENAVGQDVIQDKLLRVLSEEVPDLQSVKVAILGTRNVPRR